MRPVANEKVRYSTTTSRLSTLRCLLDVVLFWRARREPAAVEISRSIWRLRLWHALLRYQARVHALGTAIFVAVVDISFDDGMHHAASVEALHGDGLCATCGLKPCKSLTVLHVPGRVPTGVARKCSHSSSGALVLLSMRDAASVWYA